MASYPDGSGLKLAADALPSALALENIIDWESKGQVSALRSRPEAIDGRNEGRSYPPGRQPRCVWWLSQVLIECANSRQPLQIRLLEATLAEERQYLSLDFLEPRLQRCLR